MKTINLFLAQKRINEHINKQLETVEEDLIDVNTFNTSECLSASPFIHTIKNQQQQQHQAFNGSCVRLYTKKKKISGRSFACCIWKIHTIELRKAIDEKGGIDSETYKPATYVTNSHSMTMMMMTNGYLLGVSYVSATKGMSDKLTVAHNQFWCSV